MRDELEDVVVRPATTQDADPISRVHVESWRQAYAKEVPQEYLDGLNADGWAARWRERLEARHGTVLVAEDGGRVVGFVSVGASRDEDAEPGTMEIYAIYVEPDAWGRGAARELMRAALALVPATGVVTLWSLAGNERAGHFYRRHGFVPDGVERTEEISGTTVLEARYRRG